MMMMMMMIGFCKISGGTGSRGCRDSAGGV
jgi:hypothetical protein